eukprot:tig00000157_g9631.t1
MEAPETPEAIMERLTGFEEQLAQVEAAIAAEGVDEADRAALQSLREQLVELIAITRDLLPQPPEPEPPEPEPQPSSSGCAADDSEEIEIQVFDVGARVRARWRDGTYQPATVEAYEYDEDEDVVRYRLTFDGTGLLLELPASAVAGALEEEEGEDGGGGGEASGSGDAGGGEGEGVEVSHFDWDRRGVASKLMSKMGFVPGKGLGKEKHGIAQAIPVGAVLPKGTSLDNVTEATEASRERNWRRTAGAAAGDLAERAGEVLVEKETFEKGKRKVVIVRRKRAKKGGGVDAEDPTGEQAKARKRGVFDFLNASLGRAAAKEEKRPPPVAEQVATMTQQEFRGQLLKAREQAEAIKQKVASLEASVARAKKHRDAHAERAFSEQRMKALAKLAECLREAKTLEEKFSDKQERKNKKIKF